MIRKNKSIPETKIIVRQPVQSALSVGLFTRAGANWKLANDDAELLKLSEIDINLFVGKIGFGSDFRSLGSSHRHSHDNGVVGCRFPQFLAHGEFHFVIEDCAPTQYETLHVSSDIPFGIELFEIVGHTAEDGVSRYFFFRRVCGKELYSFRERQFAHLQNG